MAPKKTASFVVNFDYERDTKNKVRFNEVADGEAPKIGKLYMDQADYETLGKPAKVTVTVEAAS